MNVEAGKIVELIRESRADPTSDSESVQPLTMTIFSDPSIPELVLLDAGEPVLPDVEDLVLLDTGDGVLYCMTRKTLFFLTLESPYCLTWTSFFLTLETFDYENRN